MLSPSSQDGGRESNPRSPKMHLSRISEKSHEAKRLSEIPGDPGDLKECGETGELWSDSQGKLKKRETAKVCQAQNYSLGYFPNLYEIPK